MTKNKKAELPFRAASNRLSVSSTDLKRCDHEQKRSISS